jgi:hypothetical protein
LSIELLKILRREGNSTNGEILVLDLVGVAHVDDPGVALEGSGGLLLLDLIIMSLSIIYMLIFYCSDDDFETPRKCGSGGGDGGGCGGDDGGGGGCVGGGGGCGGDGGGN